MAKGKYMEWLQPEKLILLQGWARDGLSDEQIAHNMGINAATLYTWKNKYNKINEALKKGKEVADYEVENALYKAALEGNTTAAIFWLKNRKPAQWRDKPQEQTQSESEQFDRLISAIAGGNNGN